MIVPCVGRIFPLSRCFFRCLRQSGIASQSAHPTYIAVSVNREFHLNFSFDMPQPGFGWIFGFDDLDRLKRETRSRSGTAASFTRFQQGQCRTASCCQLCQLAGGRGHGNGNIGRRRLDRRCRMRWNFRRDEQISAHISRWRELVSCWLMDIGVGWWQLCCDPIGLH
jgi:hypothetical protein